jgi:uncharacterized membrane protein YqiK
MEQEVAEREITKARSIETQNIEKAKAIELAEQDRDIAVAERSRAQSEAKAEADKALALAVQAEEQVKTMRDREGADRQKIIELIEASKEAEREAIGIRVAAEAEKTAAADRAEAMREQARGAADQTTIQAEASAQAVRTAAEADRVRFEVEAAGHHALNTAANLLSPEQVGMQIRIKLIEILDRIIAESVKPMENIDSIKIVQIEGLNNSGGIGSAPQGSGDGSLSDQVVSSALRYRAQAPLVDQLLAEVGLSNGSLNGLTEPLRKSDTLATPDPSE